MTAKGRARQALEEREKLIAALEDLFAVGASIHDCYAATGRDYFSLHRSLKGAGRLDLMLKLKAMREADTTRLSYALGRQWQG